MRQPYFVILIGYAAGALTGADVLAAQKSPLTECKSLSTDAYKIPGCLIPVDLHAPGWCNGENIQTDRP
jgi:hypothetical protein